MIAVTVQKTYGAATARVRVRAASIERALHLAGEGARVVFPIDAEPFFAAPHTQEGIEELSGRQRGGQHVLVLSRNGRLITGSPWWADTLNIEPGEIYEVAFRADNSGIWMDHCNVLDHVAEGMMMHSCTKVS